MLENGNFETTPAGGFPNAGIGDGTTSFPSWSINGTVELVRSGQKQGGMILIVPQGTHTYITVRKIILSIELYSICCHNAGEHAVRLGNDAEIRHALQLEKGSIYSVTFSAARTCAQLETLNVSVGTVSSTVDLQTLYSVEGWDAYAWAFLADAEEAEVAFKNPGMEDDPTCGPIIDNIAIKKLFNPDAAEGTVSLPSYLMSFNLLR